MEQLSTDSITKPSILLDIKLADYKIYFAHMCRFYFLKLSSFDFYISHMDVTLKGVIL